MARSVGGSARPLRRGRAAAAGRPGWRGIRCPRLRLDGAADQAQRLPRPALAGAQDAEVVQRRRLARFTFDDRGVQIGGRVGAAARGRRQGRHPASPGKTGLAQKFSPPGMAISSSWALWLQSLAQISPGESHSVGDGPGHRRGEDTIGSPFTCLRLAESRVRPGRLRQSVRTAALTLFVQWGPFERGDIRDGARLDEVCSPSTNPQP